MKRRLLWLSAVAKTYYYSLKIIYVMAPRAKFLIWRIKRSKGCRDHFREADRREAERKDRLTNPQKYLGKE